jgi:hypothetical protein
MISILFGKVNEMFLRTQQREEWQHIAATDESEVERRPVAPPQPEVDECRRLMRFIWRRSPVRQIGERLAAAPHLSVGDIEPLTASLDKTSRSRCRERRLAAWLLGSLRLTSEQQPAACQALRDVAAAAPVTKLVVWIAVGLLVPAGYIWPILMILRARKTNVVRSAALESLGRHGDPMSVGIVASAVVDRVRNQVLSSRRVRNAALGAYPSVVAALTPAHYGALPAGSVESVCRLLRHGDREIVSLSLSALRMVGDGSAVQPVTRLARRATEPAIRAAAEELLPILLERQRNEMAPSVLLRPSSAPTAASEELLRAAVSGGDNRPDELLRASTHEIPAEHVI